MGSILWIISWFSKFQFWGMKLGHWPKLRQLHIPWRVEIELILALLAVLSEILDVFQNSHTWSWNFAIGQSSRRCTYALSTSGGWNCMSLFAIYRQHFPRYRPIFKITIFGHETLPIGQSSRSCTHSLCLSQGVKIELIFALWAVVSERRADFKNCHIWAWNLVLAKVPEVAHIIAHIMSCYLRGSKLSFRDTARFSKLSYLGMKLGH